MKVTCVLCVALWLAAPGVAQPQDEPYEKPNWDRSAAIENGPAQDRLGNAGGEAKTEDRTPKDDAPSENVVTGRVVDAETGEAIPGVSVTVTGIGSGTITDGEGSFEINVPRLVGHRPEVQPDDTALVFSFLGYRGERVPY